MQMSDMSKLFFTKFLFEAHPRCLSEDQAAKVFDLLAWSLTRCWAYGPFYLFEVIPHQPFTNMHSMSKNYPSL